MIYAQRKVKETTYYYRIKSDFVSGDDSDCSEKIEAGKTYQLDVRDYMYPNQRIHFISCEDYWNVDLNFSSDFGYSRYDIVFCRDEPSTKDSYYNVALNLKGLCWQCSKISKLKVKKQAKRQGNIYSVKNAEKAAPRWRGAFSFTK